MEEKFLTILEVSQKQAYIFKSKKLKNNIIASAVIESVTSSEFLKNAAGDLYNETDNLVYDGGGHVILEFSSQPQAIAFTKCITKEVFTQLDGLEIFAKTIAYDWDKTPAQNVKELIKQLEVKKSMRCSAFRQESFGLEQVDLEDRDKINENAQRIYEELEERSLKEEDVQKIQSVKNKKKNHKKEKKDVKTVLEQGKLKRYGIDVDTYALADKFEDLGTSKNESSFIAVIHIDGNQMGKRVADLDKKLCGNVEQNKDDKAKEAEWENYRNQKKEFSENIDADFKAAYRDMNRIVSEQLKTEEVFETLNLKQKKNDTKMYFPVRKIIMAGDDVCFVTEGRLGLECAVAYLRALAQKKNGTDEQYYSACAGVAIVHSKYPFYKAYELAEELCSSAKKAVAELGEGVCMSAIDWHIEFGDMEGGLSQIRKQYETLEGDLMNLRPYFVCGDSEILKKQSFRQYDKFHQAMEEILKRQEADDQTEGMARGKIKNLRSVLKEGRQAADIYMKANLLSDSIYWPIRNTLDIHDNSGVKIDAEDSSGFVIFGDESVRRNIFFDIIEMMDTMIIFEEKCEEIR